MTPGRAQLLLGAVLAAFALSGPASAATMTRPETSLLREMNGVRASYGLGRLRSDEAPPARVPCAIASALLR